MDALTIILFIAIILISIILIIAVLMQQGQRQGLGAIGGGAETFFGKNKAKGYEAKMNKITKIGTAVFIVLVILATIVVARQGSDTTDLTLDDALATVEPSAEATEPAAEATEPAAEATEPAAGATEPAAEAAEPAAEATEPAAEATEPAAEATEPAQGE